MQHIRAFPNGTIIYILGKNYEKIAGPIFPSIEQSFITINLTEGEYFLSSARILFPDGLIEEIIVDKSIIISNPIEPLTINFELIYPIGQSIYESSDFYTNTTPWD